MGYQLLATMKEFRLSPQEWRSLGRFEKRALHYFRVMEQYYIAKHYEKQKKEMERERERQKFLSSLPKQNLRRR